MVLKGLLAIFYTFTKKVRFYDRDFFGDVFPFKYNRFAMKIFVGKSIFD